MKDVLQLQPVLRWLRSGDKLSSLRLVVLDFVERNAGLLLVALAQVPFVGMNTMVKALASRAEPVPTTQLIAVRMVITCICSVAWMVRNNIPNPYIGPPNIRLLLVLRGVCGFFGLFAMYFSLHYLSLSDATIITFLSPTVVAALGYFVLKEIFTRKEAMAGLISFLGVILIARPIALFGSLAAEGPPSGPVIQGEVTSAQRMTAVGVALAGLVMGAGSSVTIRAIGMRSHAMHSIAYFSFYSSVVACTGAALFKDPWIVPGIVWTGGMLLIGCFGFCAQVLQTLGLQREQAGRAQMGQYVQIIFAIIMERIFFHVAPSVLSVVGSAMIICSALYVAITRPRVPKEPLDATAEEEQTLVGDDDEDAEQLELEEGKLVEGKLVSPIVQTG